MKKLYILLSLTLSHYFSFAQINTFPPNGNVGIGTTDPQFNLDITAEVPYLILRSSVYTPDPAVLTIKGGIIFNQQYLDKTAAILEAVPPGYHVPGILFSTKNAWNIPGPGTTDWLHRMFIHPNGNVGIGTITPDQLLSVAGTIHSKEVKVDLTNWPDYVFKPDYSLLPLNEVKTYIDKHQRLPEMPSEQDVTKNGLNLGEVVKLQTKKIEELTLYLIEKDKQVSDLQNDVKQLKVQQRTDRRQQEEIDQLKQKMNTLIKN